MAISRYAPSHVGDHRASITATAQGVGPHLKETKNPVGLLDQVRRVRSHVTGIERLRAQVEVLKQESYYDFKYGLDLKPSFFVRHKVLRRDLRVAQKLGLRSPIWAVNPKSRGYEFARSHGIDTPRTFATLKCASDIAWDEVPEHFVIKPENGTHARGVLPLIRTSDGFVDLLSVGAGVQTARELSDYLIEQEDAGSNSGGLMIEELLLSPYHDEPVLTPDIKLYCFYGKTGLIMVRMSHGSRKSADRRYRYFDDHGNDLGDVQEDGRVDPTMHAPRHISELVAAGNELSRALRVAFTRIDFYERKDGIVFGEITPCPGGHKEFRPDVDEALGQMWENADVQLRHDINAVGVLDPQFGQMAE